MDWTLVLHHFRAWAWWLLLLGVIVYVTLDYVSFLRQRWQRVRAVEEMLNLGFGKVYQSDNVHTAAALLGDAAAQKSVAESFGGDVDDITYGELDLPSIAKLMQALESLCDTIQLPAQPRLIDLGSGNGRAVLAMAMMRPFALCEGVEISPALHLSALRHLSLFESKVRPRLPAERAKVVLRFRCADMLQVELTRADVVFALSTAFSAEPGGNVPGAPYCMYGLRVSALCAPYAPGAQGRLPQGPRHSTCAVRVLASGVPYVPRTVTLQPLKGR